MIHVHLKVTDLFEKLKYGLLGRIEDSQWLDDESKSAALVKLRELRGHFFTWPHFWNESYVHLMMDQAGSFFIRSVSSISESLAP
jgi:predicted metalloendopeptidase